MRVSNTEVKEGFWREVSLSCTLGTQAERTDLAKTGRRNPLLNSHWLILASIGWVGDMGQKGERALTARVNVCDLEYWGALVGFAAKEWLCVV